MLHSTLPSANDELKSVEWWPSESGFAKLAILPLSMRTFWVALHSSRSFFFFSSSDFVKCWMKCLPPFFRHSSLGQGGRSSLISSRLRLRPLYLADASDGFTCPPERSVFLFKSTGVRQGPSLSLGLILSRSVSDKLPVTLSSSFF